MSTAEAPPETPSPKARIATVVGALVVAAVALAARVAQRPLVFLDGAVRALDTDSCYHLRRASQCLEHFPHVPARDPWLDWPRGAVAPWGPGFDQLLALPAVLLGARHDPDRAARIMAWVPPVLGVLVALAAVAVARPVARTTPRSTEGIAAGFVTALLPGAALTAMVGRTDHHVFEALATALVMAWLASAPATDDRRATLRFEALGALLTFTLLHVYTGSVMQCALAAAALTLRSLAWEALTPGRRPTLVGSGAIAYLGGALALLVVDRGWIAEHGQRWHHLQLSYLQPLLLVAAAAVLAGASQLGARVALTDTPMRAPVKRVGLALATLVPAAIVAVLAIPAVRDELRAGALGWLGRRDPWMASIAESMPLLRNPDWPGEQFAALFWTLPVALPLALVRWFRGRRDVALSYALVTVGVLALSLVQLRFARPAVVPFALVIAAALFEAVERLARRAERLALAPGIAAVVLVAWAVTDAHARDLLTVPYAPATLGSHEAARWIRAHAPSVTRGARAGVIAHWTVGHEVLWLGRHPVLTAGFGPYTARDTWNEVEALWQSDERHVVASLDRHDAGYVLVPSVALIHRPTARGTFAVKRARNGAVVLASEYLREAPIAAMLLAGSGAVDRGVAHLAHLRPVFADRSRMPGLQTFVPETWVFERVAGARLAGRAPEGTRVTVRLAMHVYEAARSWEAGAVAGPDGWSVTVPLPTAWNSDGGIVTDDHYDVRWGDASHGRVSVSDRAVREGVTVTALTP